MESATCQKIQYSNPHWLNLYNAYNLPHFKDLQSPCQCKTAIKKAYQSEEG